MKKIIIALLLIAIASPVLAQVPEDYVPSGNNGGAGYMYYLQQQQLKNKVVVADVVIAPTAPKFTSLLKVGSRGSEVVILQSIVGVSQDGKFGNITKSAVVTFQVANGLVGDGIVGVNTRTVLNK